MCGTNYSSFALLEAGVQVVNGQVFSVVIEMDGLTLPAVTMTRGVDDTSLHPPVDPEHDLSSHCEQVTPWLTAATYMETHQFYLNCKLTNGWVCPAAGPRSRGAAGGPPTGLDVRHGLRCADA